jgi:hypothetical protein
MIEQLPSLNPDAARGTGVMIKCHARLARQRRRAAHRKRGMVERNVLAGFAAVYFVAVAAHALSVFSAF